MMSNNRDYITDIVYPDEEVQKAQIQMILEKGMPPKKTFLERLKETYLGPGLRVIFYNGKLVVAGSLVIYAMIFLLSFCVEQYVEYKEYLALMMFPLMHLIFYSLSYWAEEQEEIVELKHSLMYSFTYIVSLRMFYISILSGVVNAFLILGMFQSEYIGKIGLIGFSSMFLFAALSIFLCEHGGNHNHIMIVAAGWSALCIILSQYGGALHYVLLEMVPIAVHAVMAVICFVGFISYIRKVGSANAYAYEH